MHVSTSFPDRSRRLSRRQNRQKHIAATFLITVLALWPVTGLTGTGRAPETRESELVDQNKRLAERLHKVESELIRLQETDTAPEVGENRSTTGFFSGLKNRVTFSGLVEFGGARQEMDLRFPGDQAETGDLALTTLELAVGVSFTPWFDLETVFLYEDPTFDQAESAFDLDVAALTLGTAGEFPLYLTAGRMYVPFGALLTHMPDDPLIDSPLTLAFGETGEKAVLLGFDCSGLAVSGYVFNGEVDEEGKDDHIDGYGIDVNYSDSFPVSPAKRIRKGEKYPHGRTMEMDLLAGLSYISNIAESDGLTDTIGEEIKDYVPGYAVYLHLGWRGLFLDGEYMAAGGEFEVDELASYGGNARPSVWNIEAGFNYDWGKNLEVVFNYAGSEEAGGLGFPEMRHGVAFNQEILPGTILSLGWLRDDYEKDDIDGRKRRELIFSQIALQF